MKRLRYFRHLRRGAYEISQKELCEITVCKALKDEYTEIFYGPLYRTQETVKAIYEMLKINCHTQQAKEIGNGTFINNALNILRSLEALDPQKCRNLSIPFELYIKALKNLFSLLPENGYGLAVGHGPIIELTAMAFGHKLKPLSYLGYVDFVQDEAGKIGVVES